MRVGELISHARNGGAEAARCRAPELPGDEAARRIEDHQRKPSRVKLKGRAPAGQRDAEPRAPALVGLGRVCEPRASHKKRVSWV